MPETLPGGADKLSFWELYNRERLFSFILIFIAFFSSCMPFRFFVDVGLFLASALKYNKADGYKLKQNTRA